MIYCCIALLVSGTKMEIASKIVASLYICGGGLLKFLKDKSIVVIQVNDALLLIID